MQGVIYLGVLIAGVIIGWTLLKVTIALIRKRVDSAPEHWLINGKKAPIIWEVFTGVGWLGFVLAYGMTLKALEGIFVFSVCLVLSAVDMRIRKIPNELLLVIMIGAIVFILWDNSLANIKDHILGLGVGAGIFLAPFKIGRQAGAGDIKYAATIGFFLGIYSAVVAFVVMSAIFFLYTAMLFITKKGDLKTKTALGPYMSLGFMVALIISEKIGAFL